MPIPLMPKGVEHYFDGPPDSVNWTNADSSDAERR